MPTTEAQVPAIKALASDLRLELTQYEEVERFSRFGTEVDEATRQQIRRGERWRRVLTQPPHEPRSAGAQILILWAASEGYLDDVRLDDILAFERGFVQYVREEYPTLTPPLDRGAESIEGIDESLTEAVEAFRRRWFEREGSEPL